MMGPVALVAVIAKDVRLRMRGWRWAGVTTLYVGLLAAVALGFLLHRYDPTPSEASQAGIRLLQALALVQLLLILFVTPASMAGSISGERQARTWELLLVSRLSSLDILAGKLLAGIAFNLLLIAASLPLFALVFLFGGVRPADLIPAFIVFLGTILLLGTISLTVSALTARLTVSLMISLLVSLSLAVGLSLLALYLQAPGQLDVLTVAGTPFQSTTTPSPLTPLAQLDPLTALLSALPSTAGGSLLGGLGTVNRAFGLPWQLPLWGAYGLLACLASLVLLLLSGAILQRALRLPGRRSVPRTRRDGAALPISTVTTSRNTEP